LLVDGLIFLFSVCSVRAVVKSLGIAR